MKTKTTSHYKLITFIVFICAAIMASVFVFHSQHKSSPTPSSDMATIFPVARDINHFDLLTKNNDKFTQHHFRNHWTLLFFGFTHCSNICPTTLEMLNRTYAKLRHHYPNLQIVFVSLDPERDTPDTVNKYAQSFNPDFIGVTGKIQDLRKLQSQFGVFSARSDSSNDYQIQHTSSIMLVDTNGKWAGLFKYGMSPKQFAQEFEKSAR